MDASDDIATVLLADDDQTTCIWNVCDPLHHRAVRGIEGHGQPSNCGRTNKDGIDFVKARSTASSATSPSTTLLRNTGVAPVAASS